MGCRVLMHSGRRRLITVWGWSVKKNKEFTLYLVLPIEEPKRSRRVSIIQPGHIFVRGGRAIGLRTISVDKPNCTPRFVFVLAKKLESKKVSSADEAVYVFVVSEILAGRARPKKKNCTWGK